MNPSLLGLRKVFKLLESDWGPSNVAVAAINDVLASSNNAVTANPYL